MQYTQIVMAVLMGLLTTWNGLLGSFGVAWFHIHVGDIVHLIDHAHADHHHPHDCAAHCETKQKQPNLSFSGPILLAQHPDCHHCIELVLKGVQDIPFVTKKTNTGSHKVPPQIDSYTTPVFAAFITPPQAIDIPPLRGPPNHSFTIERVVQKTVLII